MSKINEKQIRILVGYLCHKYFFSTKQKSIMGKSINLSVCSNIDHHANRVSFIYKTII